MNSRRNIHIALTALSALLFIPFLGHVHLFDWDEINFAEAAREMLVSGNWWRVTIDFQPFWEKPPLFIWLQALCMKVFGVNEFAARLPNALAGILTINVLYHWGSRLVNNRTGLLWSVLYLGSITPFFYFKTGIIDPVFNLFVVAGIIQLLQARRSHATGLKNYWLAGLLIGLAVLTKGPVGALVPALVFLTIWVTGRFRWFFSFGQIASMILTASAVASFWFLPEMLRNGTGVFMNFIHYQLELASTPVASHGQPWYYHAVVLLIGCFPASVFAIPRLLGHDRNNEMDRWMLALFWVVLILFSSLTTKIVHYSSLCWFPLTYLAASQLATVKRTSPFVSFLYALIGTVLSVVLILLPWMMARRDSWYDLLNRVDRKGQLNNIIFQDVHWTGLEWIPGLFLFLLVIVTTVFLFRGIFREKWIIGHFLLITFIVNLVALTIVPRVEKHTQGSIIEFYTMLQEKDVYVKPLHFKSYAHLFYARTMPMDSTSPIYRKRQSLLSEFGVREITDLDADQRNEYNQKMSHFLLSDSLQTDKPIFLVVERRKMEQMSQERNVELVYTAGPYLVYSNLKMTDSE